ncbi:hypothetical protein PPERSA_04175 [Pseudocohnilembus persalinus]|uniref:Uncharacterized protein n=1 Tax=Pseudocohnilembus persalinus TaxID=266149 RepID=A0A0V0QN82_PSEPJ|nr:hypothetical protein PPERSA_04175 [Pseudocohnilembus persalinus]|eukprot:KRX03623.1 hypothetical protein PPERSA_04175 [Pseudocohnilembus persalinus]
MEQKNLKQEIQLEKNQNDINQKSNLIKQLNKQVVQKQEEIQKLQEQLSINKQQGQKNQDLISQYSVKIKELEMRLEMEDKIVNQKSNCINNKPCNVEKCFK